MRERNQEALGQNQDLIEAAIVELMVPSTTLSAARDDVASTAHRMARLRTRRVIRKLTAKFDQMEVEKLGGSMLDEEFECRPRDLTEEEEEELEEWEADQTKDSLLTEIAQLQARRDSLLAEVAEAEAKRARLP